MAYSKCSVHVVFGFRGVFGQICFGLFFVLFYIPWFLACLYVFAERLGLWVL